MTKVLDHAQSITHHRDHALVDMAMVYSLLDMFGHGRRRFVLRLYRVAQIQGALQITLTVWTDGRAVNCEEIECNAAAAPQRMIQALTQEVVSAGTITDERLRTLHFTWLPVRRDKELLGCIELGMAKPLTQRQLNLIDGMRGLYANYLSLLRYSQIDTLTRLLNRKTFDESLQQMLAAVKAKSLNKPAAERRSETDEHAQWLAVMDIDHFKRVNDTFGHLFGDEVLILIANLMREVFRSKDRLFRFGGEEFVVLLRDTGEQNALKVFERFRRTVESHAFPQLSKVTISIGVTKVQVFDNPTTLLGRADEALYYSKHHGRNQVQFFDNLVAEMKITRSTVVHTEADLF